MAFILPPIDSDGLIALADIAQQIPDGEADITKQAFLLKVAKAMSEFDGTPGLTKEALIKKYSVPDGRNKRVTPRFAAYIIIDYVPSFRRQTMDSLVRNLTRAPEPIAELRRDVTVHLMTGEPKPDVGFELKTTPNDVLNAGIPAFNQGINSQIETDTCDSSSNSDFELKTTPNDVLNAGIPAFNPDENYVISSDIRITSPTDQLIKIDLNGTLVLYSPSTDMICVNDLINAAKTTKVIYDWKRLNRTQDFLDAASKRLSKGVDDLFTSKKGKYGGTWAHSLIAIDIAMWINPTYAVDVCMFVMRYTRGDVTLIPEMMTHMSNVNQAAINVVSVAGGSVGQTQQTVVGITDHSIMTDEQKSSQAQLNDNVRTIIEKVVGPRPLDLESPPMSKKLIMRESDGLQLYNPYPFGDSDDKKFELALRAIDDAPFDSSPKTTDDLIRIMYEWIVMYENERIKATLQERKQADEEAELEEELPALRKMNTQLLARIDQLHVAAKIRPLIAQLSPDALAKSVHTIVNDLEAAVQINEEKTKIAEIVKQLPRAVESHLADIQAVRDITQSLGNLLESATVSDIEATAISRALPGCVSRPYKQATEFRDMVAAVADISGILSADIPLNPNQRPVALSIFADYQGRLPEDESPAYYRALSKPERVERELTEKEVKDDQDAIDAAIRSAIESATGPDADASDIASAISTVVDTVTVILSAKPPPEAKQADKKGKTTKAKLPLDRFNAIDRIATFSPEFRRMLNSYFNTATMISSVNSRLDGRTISIYVGQYGYAPYIVPTIIDAVPRVYIHLVAGHLVDPGAYHLYPGGRILLSNADSATDHNILHLIAALPNIQVAHRDLTRPMHWVGIVADLNCSSAGPHHLDTIATCIHALGAESTICAIMPSNRDMSDWRVWSPAELIRHHVNKTAVTISAR